MYQKHSANGGNVMKKIVAGILLAGLISTSVIPVYAQAESPEVVYHYYEAYAGKLPAPDGLDASSVSSDSVTITWDAVKGADAYYVYQYDKASKKYKMIDLVTKTKCKVSGLKAETKYTFSVAAAVENDEGYLAQTKSEKLSVKTSAASVDVAAPSGIKITAEKNYITLKWDKVSGADAYRVYLYDKASGKYKVYKNVSGTSCKVSGLSAGTEYKFRVSSLVKVNGKLKEQKKSGIIRSKTKADKKSLPKKGGEWEAPSLEKGNADKLYTCGIGNCTQEYNQYGGIDYYGDIYFSGVKSRAIVSTNSDGDIYFYMLFVPMSYSDFSVWLSVMKDTLSSFSYKYYDGWYTFSAVGLELWTQYDFDYDRMIYCFDNTNMR